MARRNAVPNNGTRYAQRNHPPLLDYRFRRSDVAPQVLMLLLSCRCGMTAQPAGKIETGAGYSIMVCGELIWKPLIGDRVLLGQSA